MKLGRVVVIVIYKYNQDDVTSFRKAVASGVTRLVVSSLGISTSLEIACKYETYYQSSRSGHRPRPGDDPPPSRSSGAFGSSSSPYCIVWSI